MKPKDLQKLCSHCDGRIAIDASECPYCAAEQDTNKSFQPSSPYSHQSLNDSLSSLYTPPYSNKVASSHSEEKKEFTMKKAESPAKSAPYSINTNDASEESSQEKTQSAFWPLLLLSLGGNLLLLGLLQLLFSDNGLLRLEWNSSYWFIYALAALPLLFVGYKKANVLN